MTCLHTLKILRENEVNQVQRVLKDRKSMIANRDPAFQNEALNSDIANLGKNCIKKNIFGRFELLFAKVK